MSDIITSPLPATTRPEPNDEQSAALANILAWASGPFSHDRPFFVLKGYAGTGKTFCMQLLRELVKGKLIFTAPTNKATKVLRDTMRTKDYSPECRTIYSLLGLQLAPNGEIKELVAPEDPVDLSSYRLVIVDEGSMVNAELIKHIQKATKEQKVRFLFLGDPAQLPPVKELTSPIWQTSLIPASERQELTRVMRHDNQILKLVTDIRGKVDHPAPTLRIANDNNQDEGVFKDLGTAFTRGIQLAAGMGDFQQPGHSKVIAWRNVTVDAYNTLIRRQIFGADFSLPWAEDDRVIFTEPAKDPTEEETKIIASTDDEGRVSRVIRAPHPVFTDFDIYNVTVTLDSGGVAVARVLVPEHAQRHAARVERLAQDARIDRRKWHLFWEFKEAFHSLRYAYAITAHRAQGSTYDTAFVDSLDILRNPNRQEAFRCLYVACSRPRRKLVVL